MKLLPRLAQEDELDAPVTATRVIEEDALAPAPIHAAWPVGVAAVSVAARLGYLFFFNDPQNAGDGMTDAYHHWQIAFLTKEVGLYHGPRLWDMRGWEYVWGLMHPALMNVLFFATGSTDIVLARLLSLAFGSLAVVLIFLLCHRYWGLRVAVIAGAYAALSPVSIFNDVAGMAEPISIALALLGIWLLPRRGFLAGLAWALSAMARVEAWLFGAGLVIAYVWKAGRTRAPRLPLVAGWLVAMVIYARWLFDQTGNPIFPLMTSFQFVGLGAGNTGGQASHQVLQWIPFIAAALVSAACLAWTLWRQPRSYLLLTYGFGYSALSLATYLRYAAEWKERRFEFPLDFAAILIAVLLVRWLPQRGPVLRTLSIPLSALGLVLAQGLWIPVQTAYAATASLYRHDVALAHGIGAVYNLPEYRGGVLNMPGDEPTLLYLLVRDENLRGGNVTSQFYDPFYYLPSGYRYADHPDVAGPLLQCWLSDTKTRLLLISPPGPLSQSNADYVAYIADHPDWFQDTGAGLGGGWSLIGVSVPAVSPSFCAQAGRSAPHQ